MLKQTFISLSLAAFLGPQLVSCTTTATGPAIPANREATATKADAKTFIRLTKEQLPPTPGTTLIYWRVTNTHRSPVTTVIQYTDKRTPPYETYTRTYTLESQDSIRGEMHLGLGTSIRVGPVEARVLSARVNR